MYLTPDRIDAGMFCEASAVFEAGAEVLFFGVVRDHSQGRKVLYLDYEAYEPMAEKLLGEAIREASSKWPLVHARVLHRTGRVGLGEIAVALRVSAAHRDEAYKASRFLIEAIKHRVPIWKKEHFADGTCQWSLCPRDPENVKIPAASGIEAAAC